jgi:uncharacterized membrane protein
MSAFDLVTRLSRPAGEVFSFLADVGNEPQWREDVKSVVLESGAGAQAGAVYRQEVTKMGATMDVETHLTEVVPGERIGYSFASGPFKGNGTYRVSPSGDGCELTASIDLGGVMAKAIGGMVRSQLETDIAKLKQVLES